MPLEADGAFEGNLRLITRTVFLYFNIFIQFYYSDQIYYLQDNTIWSVDFEWKNKFIYQATIRVYAILTNRSGSLC